MATFLSPMIQLPIVSEAVTIDVFPLSRYGQANDIARIQTFIRLREPLGKPERFLIPKTDGLAEPKIYLPDGTMFRVSLDAVDEGAKQQLREKIMAEIQNFLTSNPTLESAKKLQAMITEFLAAQELFVTQEIPAGTQVLTFTYAKPVHPANDWYVLESMVPLASFVAQTGARLHSLVALPFDPAPSQVEAQWQTPDGGTQTLGPENIKNRFVISAFWQNDPMLTVRYRY